MLITNNEGRDSISYKVDSLRAFLMLFTHTFVFHKAFKCYYSMIPYS